MYGPTSKGRHKDRAKGSSKETDAKQKRKRADADGDLKEDEVGDNRREIIEFWAKLTDAVRTYGQKFALIILGDFNAVINPTSGGRSSGKKCSGRHCRDDLMQQCMLGMTELTKDVGYTWKGNAQQGKAAPEARLDGIWVNSLGMDFLRGDDVNRWPSAPFKYSFPLYKDPVSGELKRITDHAAVGVEAGIASTICTLNSFI